MEAARRAQKTGKLPHGGKNLGRAGHGEEAEGVATQEAGKFHGEDSAGGDAACDGGREWKSRGTEGDRRDMMLAEGSGWKKNQGEHGGSR
jgi:hypothetical protein